MDFKERIAADSLLRYVSLDGKGNIGVICNGAGYAMATCDYLESIGSKPSNFTDLGGSAYHEKVTHALILMEKDDDVDSIFINMFCGQLSGDKIAVVVKEAIEKKYCSKPIICRIKGSFADEANAILR